jgi:hypothetical protein
MSHLFSYLDRYCWFVCQVTIYADLHTLNWVSVSVAYHSDFYTNVFMWLDIFHLILQMKTQRLLLLNSCKFVHKVIKSSLIFSVILILYSITARNWLYNAHRQESKISSLKCVDSQHISWENLAKCFPGLKKMYRCITIMEQWKIEANNRWFRQKQKHYPLNPNHNNPYFSKPYVLSCSWIFIRH